ncbi:MAG: hypothetical protein MUO82_10510 [Candidatus Thermoplasmatota archaeon]|nr:hypothetical protein [Candidatus Thermoplasmatota archaeon]
MTKTIIIKFNLKKLLTSINYYIIIPLIIYISMVIVQSKTITLPSWVIAMILLSFAIFLIILNTLLN